MRYFPLKLKEDRKYSGGFTEKIRPQKALSLIEVMVALVLSSLLIGVISINFPMLKKTSDRFIQQSLFLKQYYIFLFILEDDYQRTELINLDDLSKLDKLNFRVDTNLDGDYLDSSENITYRWNKSARRIDRKSGKSKYQSLLEGIEKFNWERTNSQPVCHRLYISDAYSKRVKLTRFCRYESM